MEKKKIVIVGLSGVSKHAYGFIKDYDLYDVVGFAVNEEYKMVDTFLNLPVYSIETLDQHINKEEVLLFVALLWNKLNSDRKKLFIELKNAGYHFANLISPKASIRGYIEGENCWIHDFVVIQENAHVSNNSLMMAFSLLGSNSVLSEHCFMGTKSTVAGGCVIGEQTFVGMNCTVFDKTTVGKKCILGACSVIKRNVPDFTLCKTPSDNIVTKQYDENTIESKLIHTLNKR